MSRVITLWQHNFASFNPFTFAAICFIVAAACCGSLYGVEDTNGILGLSSVFVAMTSIGGTTVVNVIVDNFPTCLRYISFNVSFLLRGKLRRVKASRVSTIVCRDLLYNTFK